MTNSTSVAELLETSSAFGEASARLLFPHSTQPARRRAHGASSHLQTYKYDWGSLHGQRLGNTHNKRCVRDQASKPTQTRSRMHPFVQFS